MPESTKRSLVVFTYAVLMLSTLLVYCQVRSFDFVNYDDNAYVYENPHVSSGLTRDGIIWAFTVGHVSNWHPLTWLSHMLDCQLFGPRPGWMHLVNVLLHLVNTLLLFAVLKRVTGSLWRSAFVAAAFALHPMHVESVAWIAERKDVLSTLFLLLTFASYIGYTRRPSIFRYLMTLVLFASGLMAKPMLVTLPLLLLLLDYWPLGRFDAQSPKPRATRNRGATLYRLIIEKIPFLILAAISSGITFLAQRAGGSMVDITVIPLHDRVANAFLSYVTYVGKMLWPEDLAVFYPHVAASFAMVQVAMSVLLLFVVSILVVRFGRMQKYLPVGWFWFVGTLIPVIGLIQVGDQAYADRYTYIPYIGLFIVVAWGLPELLARLPHRKLVLGVSMVIVLAALGVCAHRQVSYWSNTIALFSRAIEVTRSSYPAYNNRGVAYNDLGRRQEAIEDFNQAIRIRPDYAEAYNNRGAAYRELGRLQEAIKDIGEAIRIRPGFVEAYNNRGVAYGQLGRGAEAIEDFKQTIKIQPDHAEAYNTLGKAYMILGREADAIDAFKQAIRIKPDYAEAYNNRGIAYGELGRGTEAIEDFKQTVKIQPDHVGAYNNLGKAYMILGREADAIDAYGQAMKINSDDVELYNNLAWLIATNPDIKNRDTNEAIRLASRACELTNYKDPTLLDTLAAAYASAGRFVEAVDAADKALNLADAANQPQIRDIIQYHLSFYKQGKPYIGPGPDSLPDPKKP